MPLLGSLSNLRSINSLRNSALLSSLLLALHGICLLCLAFACLCVRLRCSAARRRSQEIARRLNLNTEQLSHSESFDRSLPSKVHLQPRCSSLAPAIYGMPLLESTGTLALVNLELHSISWAAATSGMPLLGPLRNVQSIHSFGNLLLLDTACFRALLLADACKLSCGLK